jgi:hypothetical protein
MISQDDLGAKVKSVVTTGDKVVNTKKKGQYRYKVLADVDKDEPFTINIYL